MPGPARPPDRDPHRAGLAHFGADDRPASRRRLARQMLVGALFLAAGVPALFYLQFGIVDGFAVGFTIFLVVLCLLVALVASLSHRRDLHAARAVRGDMLDRIGGLWLLACAFGPLLQWILDQVMSSSLSPDNWRAVYGARVLLSIGLPVLCALPSVGYVGGKSALVQVPLLVVVTGLAALSGLWAARDLAGGAAEVTLTIGPPGAPCVVPHLGTVPSSTCRLWGAPGQTVRIVVLPHTDRVIAAPSARSPRGQGG